MTYECCEVRRRTFDARRGNEGRGCCTGANVNSRPDKRLWTAYSPGTGAPRSSSVMSLPIELQNEDHTHAAAVFSSPIAASAGSPGLCRRPLAFFLRRFFFAGAACNPITRETCLHSTTLPRRTLLHVTSFSQWPLFSWVASCDVKSKVKQRPWGKAQPEGRHDSATHLD